MENSTRPGILSVDDNPFNRDLIRILVKKQGIPIQEAENGIEALAKVEKFEFELIFMDLLMPEMDGFETIKRIRNMGIKTPIVAVSAISFKQDRRRAMESGCDHFLPKPIDMPEFLKIIKKYVPDEKSDENEPAPVADPNEESRKVTALSGMNFSGFHLLLVEENDILSKRYEKMLMKIGFQVQRIRSGNEAWERLQDSESHVDIIVSNIFTPGIDALGLLAMVKREFAEVLVFIYTPQYDAGTFQMAMQQGVDCIIPQSGFERSAASLIESGISQSLARGSRSQNAYTAMQVRRAQEQLISFGCSKAESCDFCDIAYSTLHAAGGDMAQCRRFNRAGRCGVVLGDVAGHDVTSSYMSAIFSGMLTSTWNNHQNPKELLKVLNAELIKAGHSTTHICATVILYDGKRAGMKIATAGNPGGLLLTGALDGKVKIRKINGEGMALGLLKNENLFVYEEIDFNEESYVLFFSDGIESEWVEEALSGDTEIFSPENAKGFSRKLIDRILKKHGQEDDMILLSLHVPEQFETETQGFNFSFLTGYEGVDEACLWASKFLNSDTTPEGHDVDFVLLLLREILLNAVEHGNRQKPDAYVDLSLFLKPDELKIEVSDEGPGFELDDKKKEMESYDGFQIGKRGMPLMVEMADSVEVAGGTVTLVFRRRTSCENDE